MASKRAVIEGLQTQGSAEEICWAIDTTDYGGTPTTVSCAVKCLDTNVDVTSIVLPVNTPSVAGDDITLDPLKNLVPGRTYRVDVTFTSDSQVCVPYFRVACDI